MPEISVNFIHPTDMGMMTVVIDDAMTAEEIIVELLANNFIPTVPEGYLLSMVETDLIVRPEQTLAEAGAKNGSKIQVLASTPAGAR